MRDSQRKLSTLTVVLHWLVALTIITLLSVGVYMAETESYFLYPIHKSVGIIIFSVILLRVIWRLINGWPVPVGDYAPWEQVLAKLVHWLLLLGTLLMPLSGMLMSGAGGHGLAVFGVQLLAKNPDPDKVGSVMPFNEALASVAHTAHGWVAYIIIGALLLHVAGALKHHIVDKDGTLRRMLGQRI